MTGGNMTGLNLNCRNLACNKLNLNLVIAVVTSNWLWAWNNAKWKKGWVNTFWRKNLHLQFPPEWLLNKKKHVRNSVVPPCITVQPSKSCCLKLSVIFDMFFFFWWFIHRFHLLHRGLFFEFNLCDKWGTTVLLEVHH